MKKKFMIAMSMVFGLVGCGGSSVEPEVNISTDTPIEVVEDIEDKLESVETLKIATTIFPVYDWTREVLGDTISDVDLSIMINSGVDLHSFQPTALDIVTLSESDLFICIGGESDEWVDAAVESANNDDLIVIKLIDYLGDSAKYEEIVEGMEHDHDHEDEVVSEEEHEHEEEVSEEEYDHEHEDEVVSEEEHDHEHEEVYDEHIWLSLRNAGICVEVIADTMSKLNPTNCTMYCDNADDYIEQLDSLDIGFSSVIEQLEIDTVLFADRFPFRYFVDDYGLEYYGAFAGCSAETEASFETIVFLAEKVNELGLDFIFVTESSDGSIATTVESAADGTQQIVTLNAMQSALDVDSNTYLSVMYGNLTTLQKLN